MAGAKIPGPLRFAGWPRGVQNRGTEEAVLIDEMGKQTALRGGVNVDFDELGKPSRRQGYELTLALAGLHSLWSHPRFPLMLAAKDDTLLAFDTLEDSTAIADLVGPVDAPVCFALGSQDVYFSTRHDCGMVDADGTVRPWATENPSGQPAAAADAAVGGLDGGTYQVAITFTDATGRESGATLPVEVTVPQGGGIRLTDFPLPTHDDTTWVRLYCSPPEGDTLYFVQQLPVLTSAALIGAHTPGEALDKMFLSPLPPGQCVAHVAGTVHVGRGKLHAWAEPLMHGLGRAHTNYAVYDADITLLAPVGQGKDAGLYLSVAAGAGKSAGRTYYLAGPDPKNWSRAIAHPHGAVPGSLSIVEADSIGLDVPGEVPMWFTDNGQLVVGLPGGKVQQLHADRYDGPVKASTGATAMREDDNGIKHVLTVLRGGESNRFAASDSADAEVWKHGVRIR